MDKCGFRMHRVGRMWMGTMGKQSWETKGVRAEFCWTPRSVTTATTGLCREKCQLLHPPNRGKRVAGIGCGAEEEAEAVLCHYWGLWVCGAWKGPRDIGIESVDNQFLGSAASQIPFHPRDEPVAFGDPELHPLAFPLPLQPNPTALGDPIIPIPIIPTP